jgi:O-acetylserine/cysteine efflux transporter
MSRAAHLPLRHALLALAVMVVWGSNFAVAKIGLERIPPLFFAFLRFGFAFFPACLFVPRPAFPLKLLALYGVATGAGQFGLLYIAMEHMISPGLASLVIQSQVFFTIGFALIVNGERVKLYQWGALGLALAGMALILANTGGDTTPLGVLLVLLAGGFWSAANLVSSRAQRVNMLGFMVWSSAFAAASLFLLALALEGPAAMLGGLAKANSGTWAVIAYQSLGNTLFGYGVWSWLMARHPASLISPLSLLVPVFGMATSWLWLGEALQPWKLAATALVLAGLGLNLLWPQLRAQFSSRA